jgi:hypothetical protein
MTIKGTFTVDVYDCTVHIVVSDRIKTVINNQLRKDEISEIDFAPSGFFYSRGGDYIGDYYLFFDVADVTVDILNHEKCHLVEHILTDREIKAEDETRSYLDGFISRKVDSFMKKRKIKIKNKR